VDPDTAVVDGDEAQHVPDPGHRVDLDGRDVAGERPGQVRRVVVRVALQSGPPAVGPVSVRSRPALLACDALGWVAADVYPPAHRTASRDTWSRWAASLRALARPLRATMATAAPATGVLREA